MTEPQDHLSPPPFFDGDATCRHYNTYLGTIHDVQYHRKDGYCHLPTRDDNGRTPFSRKTEIRYRLEAEASNKKFKGQIPLDIHREQK